MFTEEVRFGYFTSPPLPVAFSNLYIVRMQTYNHGQQCARTVQQLATPLPSSRLSQSIRKVWHVHVT